MNILYTYFFAKSKFPVRAYSYNTARCLIDVASVLNLIDARQTHVLKMKASSRLDIYSCCKYVVGNVLNRICVGFVWLNSFDCSVVANAVACSQTYKFSHVYRCAADFNPNRKPEQKRMRMWKNKIIIMTTATAYKAPKER